MFERFDPATREKVRRAAELAEAEQASMVEVEHLLTALVDPASDSIGHVLELAGVTSQSIRAARDREFHSALALAGITSSRPSPPASPRLRRGRATKFAPSAKLALERTLGLTVNSRERRITNESLALAILGADVGVMPRLLAELGIARDQLEDQVRRAR